MCSTGKSRNKTGRGFLNSLINSLPFEAHVPGYQFCGPGTEVADRIIAGQQGINPLDNACRSHDIAYLKSKDLNIRHKADKILENRAWERVKAGDSSWGEKAVAYGVVNAMKAKQKMGMGYKTKKRIAKKRKKPRKNVKRIIPCPSQIGGAIPIRSVFAGLSALGSLVSGVSSAYTAVKNSRKKGNGLYLNTSTGKGLYLNKRGSGCKNVNKKKN